ncbi:MAG TPA: ABC transporter ATP-binding protein, partial [Firmicutes bacterium]|nr:ABC transporter ATP-binding protein [Bacillota bacterium]
SLERISEYLSLKPAVPKPKYPQRLKDSTGQIEIKNLYFSYDETATPLFRDLNLTIRAGETLAVVGPSGSGKSTLTKLICRLYDPQRGSITIDGLDLRDIEPSDLRKNIAVVPQTITLFSGTIRDNIAYSKPDASEEEIENAAKRALIHDYIIQLPHGYNTEIGESGKGLSGGQKQLISYARAILVNPSILILDEATSSVDANTETAIKNTMEDLLENRTCIIIAHRFATLKYADRIALFDKGNLEALGTKEQLLRDSPLFLELVSRQLLA